MELIWNTHYNDSIPHAAGLCGSFWWREIIQLMPIYRGVSSVSIGNGETSLFWKDLWCGQVLAEKYPRAYSFATNEDISVCDFLLTNSLSDIFYLPLSAQAHQQVAQLQTVTAASHIDMANDDAWSYSWGSRYTSSRFYQFCFREVVVHDSYKWIWKSKCTMKLKMFAWLLLSDRLNTKNMLRRRHFVVGDGSP